MYLLIITNSSPTSVYKGTEPIECLLLNNGNLIMATLCDLYAYLERKKDSNHIESDFPWLSLPEEEREESRLEIIAWWKVDSIVKSEDFQIDKEKALSYFIKRIAVTENPFLVYRYCYFAYLLSKNRQYAEKAVDALIDIMKSLVSEMKEERHFREEEAVANLFALSVRIKYRKDDVESMAWEILDGGYDCRSKLVILEDAQRNVVFPANSSERLVEKCKQLLPLTPEHWRKKCCELGLVYAAKLQKKGIPYAVFFNEALGDIQMKCLFDVSSQPDNIALPHLNDTRLEKAMCYYKKAGATTKMLEAQRLYVANKNKLRYLHIGSSKRTDKQVVSYYSKLNEDLLSEKLGILMRNLVFPVNFLLPSLKMFKELMPECNTTLEQKNFTCVVRDINCNTQEAGEDFLMWRKYEICLLNIVRNYILPLLFSAIKQKQMTYSKLKSWMIRTTCFGIPRDYARNNEVVRASWFSQIDYAVKALLSQYQRALDNKSVDWRIPIDVFAIRFEGILRTIVADLGGRTTKINRNGNTSEAVLDDLLREPCLLKVFLEEDIDFFEYVLTSKGLNIRNNVAHSFYIPQDYGITCATLTFLCILRLAKFKPETV